LGVNIEELFNPDKRNGVSIIQNHNEGKDNSILNGAVIVLTNKEAVSKLVDLINESVIKKKK
jgi:hypothetical protein